MVLIYIGLYFMYYMFFIHIILMAGILERLLTLTMDLLQMDIHRRVNEFMHLSPVAPEAVLDWGGGGGKDLRGLTIFLL